MTVETMVDKKVLAPAGLQGVGPTVLDILSDSLVLVEMRKRIEDLVCDQLRSVLTDESSSSLVRETDDFIAVLAAHRGETYDKFTDSVRSFDTEIDNMLEVLALLQQDQEGGFDERPVKGTYYPEAAAQFRTWARTPAETQAGAEARLVGLYLANRIAPKDVIVMDDPTAPASDLVSRADVLKWFTDPKFTRDIPPDRISFMRAVLSNVPPAKSPQ